jgi:hypothetical protein
MDRGGGVLCPVQPAFSQDPKRGRPILVQRYIYSKGGGGTITLLHISICSKLVRNFSNTLGFVSTEFVPLCFLLNYDIFIQPGKPSN